MQSGTAVAATAVGGTRTLPAELSKGPGLHCLARIELTNGTLLTGRITDMDPATMNMKVDALSHVAVRRQFTQKTSEDVATGGEKERQATTLLSSTAAHGQVARVDEVEDRPVAMRCVSSMVVRGASIRYIDFISEEATGGRGLEDIQAVASSVTPS